MDLAMGGKAVGRTRGSRENDHAGHVVGLRGPILLGGVVVAEGVDVGIADDAHDKGFGGIVVADALPDGILIGPLLACERLADDDGVLLPRVEGAAEQDGDVHGLEETRLNPVGIDEHFASGDFRGFAVDFVAERRELDERDGKHARRGAKAGLHLIEVGLGSRGRVTMPAQMWIDGKQLLVAKARIGIKSVLRRADEQAGDDEQDAAGRDLRANENLAGDGFVLALASDLQGRHESEEACGHKHDHDRKEQNAPVGHSADPLWCVHSG